jgi:carbon starvation protein CstA
MKVMALFLVFNFLIEISARVTGFLFKQNLPLLHLYTLGELILISLFYRAVLEENSPFKQHFKTITALAAVLVILNTIFVQGLFEFNSYAKSLVQVLIILYALDFAFRFTEKDVLATDFNQLLRLVNSAILLYYCGSLFIFMTSQFEIESKGAFKILWDVNAVLNLIFQIVMLITLWKVVIRRPKSSSSRAPAS